MDVFIFLFTYLASSCFQLNEWDCFGSCLLSFRYECLLRGLILFCDYTICGSQTLSLTLAAGLWSSGKNSTCDVWVRNTSQVQTLLHMKAYYSYLSGEHWRGEPLSWVSNHVPLALVDFSTIKKVTILLQIVSPSVLQILSLYSVQFKKKKMFFHAYSPNCIVKDSARNMSIFLLLKIVW